MFVREIKTMVDFASELATLNGLLSDPKSLKALSKEIEIAQAIVAKRDEVLAIQSENKKMTSILALEKTEIEKKTKTTDEMLFRAEAAKNEALSIQKNAEKNSRDAQEKLKSAQDLEEKNAAILRRSSDRDENLQSALAENKALKLELEQSIKNYNDAVSKLSLVRIG